MINDCTVSLMARKCIKLTFDLAYISEPGLSFFHLRNSELVLLPEYFYTSIHTFTEVQNVNTFATSGDEWQRANGVTAAKQAASLAVSCFSCATFDSLSGHSLTPTSSWLHSNNPWFTHAGQSPSPAPPYL